MRCCVCGDYGYLMICEVCDKKLCVPCSKYYFEPENDYQCHLCNPDQSYETMGKEMFECSLCFEEFPVEAKISVESCSHQHMKGCSNCMFRYVFTRRAKCPFCNRDVMALVHDVSARKALVSREIVERNFRNELDPQDTEAPRVQVQNDPNMCLEYIRRQCSLM